MRVPTLEGLRALIACEDGPCVSLYLPTVTGGSPDDRHHFHAELNRLQADLLQSQPAALVEELLRPLEALSTPEFWREAKSTLVAFRSLTTLAHWHLPMELPERALVSEKTHIRPLLPHLQGNRRFYVLSLGADSVQLYRGSAIQLNRMELGLVQDPAQAKLQAAGPFAETEPCLDSVSSSSDPLRRIRMIERAVAQAMAEMPLPLLVAAPERELWMFRSVARFDDMVSFGLVGDFTAQSIEVLHARAWPVVRDHLEAQDADVLDRWGLLSSTQRATDDLSAIVRASALGRVRELIIDREAVVPGRLDAATGTLHGVSARETSETNNLLEELAESVSLHGGEVFRLRRDRMPTRSPIAATLRW